MNEKIREDSNDGRAVDAALTAGLVLHFAILFVLGDSPIRRPAVLAPLLYSVVRNSGGVLNFV